MFQGKLVAANQSYQKMDLINYLIINVMNLSKLTNQWNWVKILLNIYYDEIFLPQNQAHTCYHQITHIRTLWIFRIKFNNLLKRKPNNIFSLKTFSSQPIWVFMFGDDECLCGLYGKTGANGESSTTQWYTL